MAGIEFASVIAGVGPTALPFAGPPSAGTSEVQTLTFGGTPSDTFTLTLEGYTTAAIAWSATNTTLVSNIDAALEALPNVGTGGVVTAVGTMTAGVGTITLTFSGGNRAAQPLGGTITAAPSATYTSGGGTLGVARTTPGVAATFRGVPEGTLVSDITNGVLYINTGTGLAPTWTKVGLQT